MEKQYRILITSRDYSAWHLAEDDTYVPTSTPELAFSDAAKYKLFSRDIITISETDGTPRIVHSPTRCIQIPGVLILEGNKTYGRTDNLKRLFYKCIPNDRYLPAFLIPYDPEIGFSKTLQNRFVVFEFVSWDKQHPTGKLTENLGPVNDLSAFCEYQLFCRSIHDSISQFNKSAGMKCKQNDATCSNMCKIPEYQIEDMTQEETRIFTIDPEGATDHDDAFSIVPISEKRARVSVYISNVYLWLEYLNLWNSFSNRVSTIYLPDCKRPMLPTILSEKICSLVAGNPGVSFCMEIDVDLETGTLCKETATFNNKCIIVARNYAYQSAELLFSREYQMLLKTTRAIDSAVVDSQDVVSFWMVQMNTICGELLRERGVGIFREATFHPNTRNSGFAGIEPSADLPEDLPNTTRQLITNWKHTTGQYVAYYDGMEAGHAIMGKSFYVHITSPIRRLVDLLNQILFISTYNTADVSIVAIDFVKNWIGRLDYINTAMRSIRKVQVDCNMLQKCTIHPEWMEKEHRGVVFDRIKRTDGLYSYMVHLVDLNLLSRFLSPTCIEENRLGMFRMFVFGDEDRLQRKIRVMPSGK